MPLPQLKPPRFLLLLWLPRPRRSLCTPGRTSPRSPRCFHPSTWPRPLRPTRCAPLMRKTRRPPPWTPPPAPVAPQPPPTVRVGGQIVWPRLISSVPPEYPSLARARRLTGDVLLDVLIDAAGKVSDMKVLSGPVLLRDAAMDALRQWRYEPARLNGQPTPIHMQVTIKFRAQ